MAVPTLIPPGAGQGQCGDVAYHIEGELVPVLHLQLGNASVYFEHHILLWKDPRVDIGIKALRGAFKRMLAGMPIIMTQTQGSGGIAFSRDTPGHVFALHVPPGHSLEVREHQFLAATESLDYSFAFVKGASNILFGGTGLFIDTFTAPGAEGVVFLHGSGNVFEVSLSPGEQLDVEPGGWIYKDPSVTMETKYQGLRTGILASAGQLVWNRFTGPGRVGIQSMYVPPVATGGKG
jgi:uncharacterized protein (AIM24 family)